MVMTPAFAALCAASVLCFAPLTVAQEAAPNPSPNKTAGSAG